MKIEINIKNTHVLVALLFIIVASTIGLVIAAPNPGHGWAQMDCDSTLCANTATGSVGIGTTNPIRALQVQGELSITRDDRVAFIEVSDKNGNNGGTIWLRGLTNNGVTGTDATVIISGNVGIGTTTPRNDLSWPGALDVNGQVRAARYYDDDINYYADLNSGGNLGGSWDVSGTVRVGGGSVQIYRCPEDRSLDYGGGQWASFGCLGQLSTSNTCKNICIGRADTVRNCIPVNIIVN